MSSLLRSPSSLYNYYEARREIQRSNSLYTFEVPNVERLSMTC